MARRSLPARRPMPEPVADREWDDAFVGGVADSDLQRPKPPAPITGEIIFDDEIPEFLKGGSNSGWAKRKRS